MKKSSILFALLFTVIVSLSAISCVFAAEQSVVESGIKDFIRKFYSEREDVYIKLNMPSSMNDKMRIRHINFVKIPDLNGDGLCLVEVDEKNGRTKNLYVPFRVSNKRKMFVLKYNLKRGDIIHSDDVFIREVFINGNGSEYPLRKEDVTGKALKRDMQAGTVLTSHAMEDSYVVQRGDTVSIVAENRKLMIQAKGRTMEKGKIGDIIRVKNLTSNREVVGRVADSGTVKVDL